MLRTIIQVPCIHEPLNSFKAESQVQGHLAHILEN